MGIIITRPTPKQEVFCDIDMVLLVLSIISVMLIVIFLKSTFTITTVYGGSMYPTLEEGDRLLTFNLFPELWLRRGQIAVGVMEALNSSSPAANILSDDIVQNYKLDIALPSVPEPGAQLDMAPRVLGADSTKFIKRVTGLPGDKICIPFASLHKIRQKMLEDKHDLEGNLVWIVPDRHCFVQGDSPVCVDSLTVGPIPIAALTGVAVLKLPRREPIGVIQS